MNELVICNLYTISFSVGLVPMFFRGQVCISHFQISLLCYSPCADIVHLQRSA